MLKMEAVENVGAAPSPMAQSPVRGENIAERHQAEHLVRGRRHDRRSIRSYSYVMSRWRTSTYEFHDERKRAFKGSGMMNMALGTIP
jgi:hypothetical protein